MKEISKGTISIIGGADGPSSVFVAGRKKGVPIKRQIQNGVYKWKGKHAARKITAGERTLSEVVAYAVEKYNAIETDMTQRMYASQKKCLKESLISRYKPELFGELKEVIRPDDYTPKTVKVLQDQFRARMEMVEAITDEQMPMDFHLYEISISDGRLEMEIDYYWNIFLISYSGSKKAMKRMKEIAKDLYLYYGVSEADIQNKSERYHSLLATLSI